MGFLTLWGSADAALRRTTQPFDDAWDRVWTSIDKASRGRLFRLAFRIEFAGGLAALSWWLAVSLWVSWVH